MIETKPIKFKLTAKVLHWLSATVILWATISGLFLAFVELAPHTKNQILDFNLSVTTVFIPFFIWRILNSFKTDKPSYDDAFSTQDIKLADYMHKLLYLLVSLVLLTGVLMLEKDFQIFKMGHFTHIVDDQNTLDLFKLIHHYSSYILATCIVLHVLAVVKHEYKGLPVLRSML